MSDQSAEAKANRRRWVTIGEVVGIAALAISALSFWDSHRDRVAADEKAAVAEKRETVVKSFILTASGTGDSIALKPARDEQAIQDQVLVFPTAISADPIDIAGDAEIEAGWIEDGVRKAKGDGDKERVRRVPVAIVTRYVGDGEVRTDRAIYDLAYSLHDRLIGGDEVKLEGLRLLQRGAAADPKAALDAIWAKRAPAPKS